MNGAMPSFRRRPACRRMARSPVPVRRPQPPSPSLWSPRPKAAIPAYSRLFQAIPAYVAEIFPAHPGQNLKFRVVSSGPQITKPRPSLRAGQPIQATYNQVFNRLTKQPINHLTRQNFKFHELSVTFLRPPPPGYPSLPALKPRWPVGGGTCVPARLAVRLR